MRCDVQMKTSAVTQQGKYGSQGGSLIKNIVQRLLLDDSGQDVVEYALLSAFIGLGSYGGFVLIQNTIQSSYAGWDSGQQGLYQPQDPGAFGS
jgi:Flp pilus assembly pilin Flp